VGTSTRTGGCNLCPVTIPVGIVDNYWVVGRGTREGVENYWFNGLVDEVRVSDIALQLSDFLQPPPPAPPIGDIAIQLVGTDSISLTWTTGADYSYMLMEKADLQDSTWSTNTAGIPSGINGNATVTVPATGDAGFFGVVLEQ